MNEIIQFLIRHGYTLLFFWVFAEQVGVPIPAAPILLAAGALAGQGQLHLATAVGLSVIAAFLSDLFWYLLGRRKGGSVLSLLCRISLNPDSCIRRTVNIFSRYGSRSLLVAKFIPGINTVAPSMAGIFRMHLARFILFDGLGACFWVGLFAGLGYLFSDQLEAIAYHAFRLGALFLVILIASLAAYVVWKYIQRRRFLRHLRIARITPEELKSKLDAGEDLMILDVRHSLEFKADPQTIPGALFWPLEQIEKGQSPIPSGREVILYCN
jgi:membrane protein DedA with SNARE-associated domain